MNNFRILLKQEFLHQIKSFKFLVMSVLTLIITVFTVYVQILDFNERFDNYSAEDMASKIEAKKSSTFAQLNVPIVIPPNPLSIYSIGFDEKAGNKVIVSVEDLPELNSFSQKRNPFMSIFMNFDIVSIVKIIMSLMAIYLIADTVSIEREEETLKMIFVNRVTRLEFFLAKFFAVLVAISIPLFGVFLFSSVFITLQPMIQLSFLQWISIALVYISSLIYLSVFVLVGLWISIRTRSSLQSMIYGLLAWIVIVFLYPNFTSFMVERFVNLPSSDELDHQIQMIDDEFGKALIEDYKLYYPVGRKYTQNASPSMKYSYSDETGHGVALPLWMGPTSKFKMEFHEGQVKRMIPSLISSQNKILDLYDAQHHRLLMRKRKLSYLQLITPGYQLDEISRTFCNTSFQIRVINLTRNIRKYRNDFIKYIEANNGFSEKYFTQIPKEIWTDDFNELWNNPIYDIYRSPETCPKLNLTDIPTFDFESSFKIHPAFFYLLLVNLILFILVARSFITMRIV
jgi:ABC-type transport system involved in multi-copper enzyme maturation permease subunit